MEKKGGKIIFINNNNNKTNNNMSAYSSYSNLSNLDEAIEDNITSSNSSIYVNRSPMYSPLDYTHPINNITAGNISNNNNNNSNSNNLGGFSQQIGNKNVNYIKNDPNLFSPSNVNYNNSIINNNNNGSLCNYKFHYPLFGLDWSTDDFVCVSSYKEDSKNKLEIIKSNDLFSWKSVVQADVVYPISNIQWLPSHIHPRQLATGSDSLRIWSLNDDIGVLQEQINLSLYKYKKQHNYSIGNKQNFSTVTANTTNNSSSTSSFKSFFPSRVSSDDKLLGELPPVTSFHWNPIDTNMLVSSSIDTTCIVWDLQSTNYVKTQLIAHDSEVYDVRFLTKSIHLFASCGGDGSVRVFDLRSLAHSTIIYEPSLSSLSNPEDVSDMTQQKNALLRLEPSSFDPNILATFVGDTNRILILDMRNPESPVLILEGHSSAVNQIKWHPTKRNVLLSCGDDCQVLYWDLNLYLGSPNIIHKPIPESNIISNGDKNMKVPGNEVLDTPNLFYSGDSQEINNIVWKPHRGDWFGYVSGKKFQNVKI